MWVGLHLHIQFIGPLLNVSKEKTSNKFNSLYCIDKSLISTSLKWNKILEASLLKWNKFKYKTK